MHDFHRFDFKTSLAFNKHKNGQGLLTCYYKVFKLQARFCVGSPVRFYNMWLSYNN